MLLTTHEAIDTAARFSPAHRDGYSPSEVDAFVAEVRRTVEALRQDLHAAQSARSELEGRLAAAGARADGPDGSVPVHVRAARLLELAQQCADSAVAEAQGTATRLLADARERAAALEGAARERVEALERTGREQEGRLRDRIGLLEGAEAEVRDRVAELTARLAGVLDGVLDGPPPTPRPAAPAPAPTQDRTADEEEAPVTIYEQLGREHGIATAVEAFYERVVADPELAPYFTGTDMATLRRHQTALLVQVTGGPVQYEGRALGEAHAGLAITPDAFDRVVAHLAATLTDLGVESAVVEQVGAALGSHRAEIVQDTADVG